MKKHSGKVICSGLLIVVFGLIVMAGVSIVTESIVGTSKNAAPEIVNLLSASGDTSWILIVIGALALVVGIFMRNGVD
jgi:hypothetical protein